MGPKSSKAKSPAPAESEVVVVPRIPQEIIGEILDYLAADLRSLRSCALVSKSWLPSCRRHLFHAIFFTSETAKWFETLQEPEESPARHVRDLRFSIRGYDGAPEKFFEYIPWFTNVEKVTLLGHGSFQPLWIPWLWKLPQSVTSLTINAGVVAVAQIRDIIVQLPNLDDLSLSGSVVAVDRRRLVGIGTALRGRFGGQLRLLKGHADKDVMDMLLEIPTGLHFTDVQICGTRECLLSTVRLAEACCKTIVKVSYTVSVCCESHLFSWSGQFWHINTDTASECRRLRSLPALLRLFQIPEPPGGGVRGRLDERGFTMDPNRPFYPQTRHLATLIHH